ncbi:O-antigen export protein [Spirochaetia bacterium]|nr:O-antigen export protein [Spirochaetia bacterium]
MNVFFRPISMIISLIYTPLMLGYLGDEKYGVWVTMLSILNWITVFDIGIGNGLRNVLTVKVGQGKDNDAQGAVSSAYYILGSVVGVLFLIGLCICLFVNWNGVFKTSLIVRPAIIICLAFICVNFILSLQKNLYFSVQKPEATGIIGIVVQLINLVGVLLLKYYAINELLAMSVLTGLSTFSVNIIFSVFIWKKYPFFVPIPTKVKKIYIKEVCNIGVRFFIIQVSGLILFTTDNFIISMLYGAEVVTTYSIPLAIFNVINGIFMAILTPFWSKFTEKKEQNNWVWIKKALKLLDLLLIPFILLIIFVILFFDVITKIWLGRVINYAPWLIVSLGIYCFLQIYNAIYSTVLNGIGAINLQLVLALSSAIINIPLSIFFAKYCGLGPTGVCLATIFGFIIGAVVFTIQINRIVHKNLYITGGTNESI